MKDSSIYRIGNPEYKIPFQILSYAEEERKFNHLKVFLWLKFNFPEGGFYRKQLNKSLIPSELSLNYRTILNVFNWLIQENWIGLNKKKDKYYLRGFDTLRIIYKWEHTSSFRIQKHHVKELEAFWYACKFHYLKRKGTRGTQKDGEASQLLDPFQIGINYYAQYYKISDRTAAKQKKMAKVAGYIKTKHVFAKRKYQTPSVSKEDFKVYCDEIEEKRLNRIIRKRKKKNGIIYSEHKEQLPDKIYSKVESCKRISYKKLIVKNRSYNKRWVIREEETPPNVINSIPF